MLKQLWILLLLLIAQAQATEYYPIVLWHGMGDSCCNPKSMGAVKAIFEEHLPGVFVHSVSIAGNEDDDQRAGFFGNVNEQVDKVCTQLREEPRLRGGFNAVGFSQGGLFLRAYMERCNDPKVHHLITFGSPHGGVSDIPGCATGGLMCQIMRSIAKRGAYSGYVRDHVVQAQYYKDPNNLDAYLEYNIFLPDINNELPEKNASYNLADLTGKFVMVRFSNDTMLKPKETAWFWFYDSEMNVVPLRAQPLYREDWLGLRTLDQQGRLVFKDLEEDHMRVSKEYLVEEIVPFLAEPKRTRSRLLVDQHLAAFNN
ncbi:uncharacterized protein VTP21DRAFT_4186 [Calcarisporiella thermophila]|uniref:uncharacterized protein n=1 Tax=Calcarisporiella thermophila TaxID=911321 RepID=UPI003742E753